MNSDKIKKKKKNVQKRTEKMLRITFLKLIYRVLDLYHDCDYDRTLKPNHELFQSNRLVIIEIRFRLQRPSFRQRRDTIPRGPTLLLNSLRLEQSYLFRFTITTMNDFPKKQFSFDPYYL